jgi:hypothetical protein
MKDSAPWSWNDLYSILLRKRDPVTLWIAGSVDQSADLGHLARIKFPRLESKTGPLAINRFIL